MKTLVNDRLEAFVQKPASHGYQDAYMLKYEGTRMEAEGIRESRQTLRNKAVSFGGWRG
ncbi:hypothetical protein [Paenibacillus sp. MBLB4367]|uniref:hypothetical protein n=1 Tax=Paenibacillus sp. MBLB4367 TaxID=3384767 RepID=UPI00390845A3